MSESPNPADIKNGENLLLIKDRRIAVSYMIEALRIFDHYHFRVAQQNAKKANRKLQILKPPRKTKEKTWFEEDYTNARKIRDRELFSVRVALDRRREPTSSAKVSVLSQ